MNLYSYKKQSQRKLYYVNGRPVIDNIVITKNEPYSYNKPKRSRFELLKINYKNSSSAGLIIPLLLISTGVFFIYQQFLPDIKQVLEQNSGYLTQGNISPVSDSYVNYDTYLSNPEGLNNLTRQALNENILAIDEKSLGVSGKFYITIPSLGIDRLPVEANVDSTTEEAYNAALKSSLAHFRGTGLPISDVLNNMVIYGHSASPNYSPRRDDPEVAFSYLPELRVGDDIIIEMHGKKYEFTMFRSKIVQPNDISIITGSKNQKTLTLFTCYPAGNNSHRYVIVAREK